MNEILQNSDFRLSVTFVDICNNPINIKSFIFEYSTPLSESFVVSYDGENYVNCEPKDGGIVAIFNRPLFNVGQLQAKRAYTIESDDFTDGQMSFLQVDMLPIEIVTSFSGVKKSKVKPYPVSQGQCILFIDTIMVQALRGSDGLDGKDGKNGEKGSPLDLVISDAPVDTGATVVCRDGVERKVYEQVFYGNIPAIGQWGSFGGVKYCEFKLKDSVNEILSAFAYAGDDNYSDTNGLYFVIRTTPSQKIEFGTNKEANAGKRFWSYIRYAV